MRLHVALCLLALSACSPLPRESTDDLGSQEQALRRVRDDVDIGGGGGGGGVVDDPPPTQHRAAMRPVAPRRLSLRNPPTTFTNREVVGLVPPGESCPAQNALWQGGALFPGVNAPSRSGHTFCAYSWVGTGNPTIESLPKYCPSGKGCDACPAGWTCEAPATGEAWLEPNHVGLFKSGLPDDALRVIADGIKAQHARATGMPAVLPKGGNPNNWLAFLPSWTKVVVLDDSGVHGDAVEHWIRQTGCGGGACNFMIERRNVFGDQQDVASVLALARSIVDVSKNLSGFRTVLNLSLGFFWKHAWNGQLPAGNDDVLAAQLHLAHEALESAINYAGCQGAITIAAAGNRDGGSTPEEQGPDYWGGSTAFPAAFAALDQGWTCTASPANAGRPLIYPAGGIKADGSPAQSARLHGQSCMTAPSLGLTKDGVPMEGTSFAAAALSGAAAAVWGYMPTATGAQMMGQLHAQSQSLPGEPLSDVCAMGSSNRGRRLHMCRAIRAALDHTCRSNPSNGPYPQACGLRDQLTCSDIPQLDNHISLGAADAELVHTAVQDPALQRPRSFSNASVAPANASCGWFSSVLTDPSDRNAYSCPFSYMDNGQQAPHRMCRSPGDPNCGCSVMLAPDRSLWLIGKKLSPEILSPALRLALINPLPVQQPASFLTVPSQTIYELGSALPAGVDVQYAIKLSDALPEGTRISEAEFSFVSGTGAQQAAFSSGVPVVQAAP